MTWCKMGPMKESSGFTALLTQDMRSSADGACCSAPHREKRKARQQKQSLLEIIWCSSPPIVPKAVWMWKEDSRDKKCLRLVLFSQSLLGAAGVNADPAESLHRSSSCLLGSLCPLLTQVDTRTHTAAYTHGHPVHLQPFFKKTSNR